MFTHVVVLIACLHLAAANYRTCNCDIRDSSSANAVSLLSWSKRLYSTCFGCRFPGFHVSCSDVKSWCPNTCLTMANGKLGSSAELNAMCKHDIFQLMPPGFGGTPIYAHSKVMSNCGGSGKSFILHSKLCCSRSASGMVGRLC